MLKKFASHSAALLLLTVSLAPASRLYAQSAVTPVSPAVVTGGDPQPTGEPDGMQIFTQVILAALGLS